MGQLMGEVNEGGGYPLQRDFPLGGPIWNLARTPMGQLGDGEIVGIFDPQTINKHYYKQNYVPALTDEPRNFAISLTNN